MLEPTPCIALKNFFPHRHLIAVLDATHGHKVLHIKPASLIARIQPGMLIHATVSPRFTTERSIAHAVEIEHDFCPAGPKSYAWVQAHLELAHQFVPENQIDLPIFSFLYSLIRLANTQTTDTAIERVQRLSMIVLLELTGFYCQPLTEIGEVAGISLWQAVLQPSVDDQNQSEVQLADTVLDFINGDGAAPLDQWINACLSSHRNRYAHTKRLVMHSNRQHPER